MAKAGISLHAIQEKDGYCFSLQHTSLLFPRHLLNDGPGFNALSFLNNELLKVLANHLDKKKRKSLFWQYLMPSASQHSHFRQNFLCATNKETRWAAAFTALNNNKKPPFFYKPRRHPAPWFSLPFSGFSLACRCPEKLSRKTA